MSVVTNPDAIQHLHRFAQLRALNMEILGMQSRGGSMYAHIKRTYNLKGNKQRVYDQFAELIEDLRPPVPGE